MLSDMAVVDEVSDLGKRDAHRHRRDRTGSGAPRSDGPIAGLATGRQCDIVHQFPCIPIGGVLRDHIKLGLMDMEVMRFPRDVDQLPLLVTGVSPGPSGRRTLIFAGSKGAISSPRPKSVGSEVLGRLVALLRIRGRSFRRPGADFVFHTSSIAGRPEGNLRVSCRREGWCFGLRFAGNLPAGGSGAADRRPGVVTTGEPATKVVFRSSPLGVE